MNEQVNILVATPYGKNGKGGIDRLNDSILAEVEARPELGLACRQLVTRGKGGLAAAQAVFAAALARLAAMASAGRVDLVHIHLSVRGSTCRKAIVARASRALSTPYVLQLHGTDYGEFWDDVRPWARREIDTMFRYASGIVVLGDFWAKVVLDRLPDVADRVFVLKNATKAACGGARRQVSGAPLRIVFLGQLGRRKGSADVLAALLRLKDVDGWTATLAGDGAVEEARELARSSGLSSRVDVPGWLELAARDELLRESDVLVLPSRAENLPMVILEAFAHGVPVVSTPVGAIPEVVEHGRNGLLVAPGDVSALAEALRRFIDDPSLARRMGEAARADHAKHYDLSSYVERLAAVWRAAAGRRGVEEDVRQCT